MQIDTSMLVGIVFGVAGLLATIFVANKVIKRRNRQSANAQGHVTQSAGDIYIGGTGGSAPGAGGGGGGVIGSGRGGSGGSGSSGGSA